MRIFQVLNIYGPFLTYFESKYAVEHLSFKEHTDLLLKDRFHALHILKPCLDDSGDGFLILWGYRNLQEKWAKENGLNTTDLKEIMFAQLKAFKPDVFYNFATDDFSKEELRQHVDPSITRICWSAAPFRNTEQFKLYKTRLTNYPGDILPKEKVGFRNDLFNPSYDDIMDNYSQNDNRPIDLFFYGQYAEVGFENRNRRMERLLEFKRDNPKLNIQLCLQYRLKEHLYVNIPYVRRYLRRVDFPPKVVWKYANKPVYGIQLYEMMSRSKIVFNAGVDFTKEHKVNMRNFESLGCGAHMLSDKGIYPEGFQAGTHFTTYDNMDDCLEKVHYLLNNKEEREAIAKAGHEMVKTQYSKEKQWNDFKQIVASL